MRFKVVFEVDANLDEWSAEYGISAAEALTRVTTDLHDSVVYLLQDKHWSYLARLAGKPHVSLPDVFPQPLVERAST